MGLSVELMVGVFGLAASYSLLLEDLMSKLMGLLTQIGRASCRERV